MESLIGFQRYWLILKRHWLPASAVFGSVFALTILSSLLQKPVYVAEGELLLKKTSTTSALTGLGKEIGQLDALQQQDSPLDTEAEILRSVPITQKTLTRLNLKDKNGELLGLKAFRDHLSVNKIKGTNLIQVSYKDSNPQQAAEVVNTLMAVYIENNVLVNRAEAVAAREFVQKQLPRAEANLRQADLELRRFQEQNQIVNLAEESRTVVDIVANLQEKINQTQTELADAQAQSTVIKGQLNQSLREATSVTSISQSPAVQDLLKEVQKVESQLVIERSRFREDHPIVVSLKNQKANLERLLQARVKKAVGVQQANSNRDLQSSEFEQDLTEELFRIETKRVGLTNQIAALSKLRSSYDQRLNALPQLEQKQRELERKLQAAQATNFLLS